jgi:cytochrome oxidase Cu insertion factor (SCO1/SenC/PrrC family)
MRWTFNVVVLVVLAVAGCTSPPQSAGPSPEGSSVPVVQRGEMAPDFTLPQASGRPVKLADLHGKPVLLYFSMGPG